MSDKTGYNETTKVELTFEGVIPGDEDIATEMKQVAYLIENGDTQGSFSYEGGTGSWKTWVE